MGWNARDRDVEVERVRHAVARHLRPHLHGEPVAFDLAVRHLPGEPVTFAAALRSTFEPYALGEPWGPAWGTAWFRCRAVVPDRWAGSPVVARFAVEPAPGGSSEALLHTAEGVPWQGISKLHPEARLLEQARGGEEVELYLEAAARPPYGVEGAVPSAAPEGPPLMRLALADLVAVRDDVWSLVVLLEHLADLAAVLPADEPRAHEVLRGVQAALRVLPPDDPCAGLAAAREALSGVLGAPAAASAPEVTAVGHAHLDTAWLWPLRETKRKSARTLSTVLRLMERYDDFRFVCSQAQQYAWVRDGYPSLFAQIRERVAEGRFEPVGSMWVEADTNLPSGESLVRQLVHGKRFFLDELGYEPRDVWLPDSFGYSAALPQLCRLAGVDWFVFTKLAWNQTDELPHNTFRWRGLDGSEVLAHLPPVETYSAEMTAAELVRSVHRSRDHGVVRDALYPFGWGDGGGGPTAEMVERRRLSEDLEGLPRVGSRSLVDFCERLEPHRSELPVWDGELYLELHRGTYTTQGHVKRGNRLGEVALRGAELWSALARPGSPYPGSLHQAWEALLLHQFHDVLAGSSLRWAYLDAAADHRRVLALAEVESGPALAALAADVDTAGLTDPVVVFNATTHERTCVVDTGRGPRAVRLPGLGHCAVDLSDAAADELQQVEATTTCLDNGRLRVTLDERGWVTSLRDREHDREVLAGPGNVLQAFRDEPLEFDAWELDRADLDRPAALDTPAEVQVVESGLRGRVRVVRAFNGSVVEQVVGLDAGSRVLTFTTEVDWHERHTLLKVAFPVAVRSRRATYGVQLGHLDRPTHTNTSWDRARYEVPAQRWADLSEGGYGVGLLSDCKYGFDVHGDLMRLTLLRGPTSPDAEADQGRHVFTYAVRPHAGDLRDVVETAEELGDPPVVVPVVPGTGRLPARHAHLSVDRRGVVVSAVKAAYDRSALVVRLYDAWGQRGAVRLRLPFAPASVRRVDLLERDLGAVEVAGDEVLLELRPFEVVTLLAEATG